MDDKTVLIQHEGITVSVPVSPAFAKFLCLLLEPRVVEISNTRPSCYQIVNMIDLDTQASLEFGSKLLFDAVLVQAERSVGQKERG